MKPSQFDSLSGGSPFDRRSFSRNSAASLAAGALSLTRPLSNAAEEKKPVIDTNAYLGPCPFRRLPLETSVEDITSVPRFASAMKEHAMVTWVSSFEALLRRDYDDINERLVAMANSDRDASHQFQLFGAINPKVSGWRETLHRIHQVHRMRGIRLHPNYHGYTLEDPEFAALIDAAAQRDLIVQIAMRMEDPRTQHPAVSVADVDPQPLLTLLPTLPGLRVQLLNAMRSISDSLLLARLSVLGVHFEIAMLEGMAGVARMIEVVPEIKMCYGSYAPFFYPESAALKMVESTPDLDSRLLSAVSSHHAENLLMRG